MATKDNRFTGANEPADPCLPGARLGQLLQSYSDVALAIAIGTEDQAGASWIRIDPKLLDIVLVEGPDDAYRQPKAWTDIDGDLIGPATESIVRPICHRYR
jgi:hypothetical protein